MLTNGIIVAQTKKWITDVVVGCNFCPFAARELKRGSIQYQVIQSAERKDVLEALAQAFNELDANKKIETTILILPNGFDKFSNYLQLAELAESLLKKEGYEGIYQVAGFHPQYIFAGSSGDDPANYTNRSPYPMLHLLREESLSLAIDNYPGTENIPQKNIEYANAKGLAYMQLLREACMAEAVK